MVGVAPGATPGLLVPPGAVEGGSGRPSRLWSPGTGATPGLGPGFGGGGAGGLTGIGV
jgi:hypothetical protein